MEDDDRMGVQIERQSQTYRARPEPGQLVEVRRRQWVVADVDTAGPNTGTPQHCLTLSLIDEYGLSEELQIIREVEPGAQVIERAGLPSVTGLDNSDMLNAFLDATRWGAATGLTDGQWNVAITDLILDGIVERQGERRGVRYRIQPGHRDNIHEGMS